MISRNLQTLLDHYEIKHKQKLKRFHMNHIPLSDRSVRLLTAPISELMAEEAAKRELRRRSWYNAIDWLRAGGHVVRPEHRINIRADVS